MDQKERDRQYAIQFFGFSPEEFGDDLNSLAQELLASALKALGQQVHIIMILLLTPHTKS